MRDDLEILALQAQDCVARLVRDDNIQSHGWRARGRSLLLRGRSDECAQAQCDERDEDTVQQISARAHGESVHGYRAAKAISRVSFHRTDSDGGAVAPFRVTPAAHQKGELLGSGLQPEDARAGILCRDERLAANAARQVFGFGLVSQEYRYFCHPRSVT